MLRLKSVYLPCMLGCGCDRFKLWRRKLSDEQNSVSAILKCGHKKTRGRSDFWDWPLDKRLPELDVAKILVNYLAIKNPGYAGSFAFCDKDPPDDLFFTNDGRRLGIEVSEIVDEQSAAMNRHAKKADLNTTHRKLWTLDGLVFQMESRILKKNRLLTDARNNYDEIFLALMTDEFYIDPALAQQVSNHCTKSLENIDHIYFVLSYSPTSDRLAYPDGYPIF